MPFFGVTVRHRPRVAPVEVWAVEAPTPAAAQARVAAYAAAAPAVFVAATTPAPVQDAERAACAYELRAHAAAPSRPAGAHLALGSTGYLLVLVDDDTGEHVNVALIGQDHATGRCLAAQDVDGAARRAAALLPGHPWLDDARRPVVRATAAAIAERAESLGAGGLGRVARRYQRHVLQMRRIASGVGALEERFPIWISRYLPGAPGPG